MIKFVSPINESVDHLKDLRLCADFVADMNEKAMTIEGVRAVAMSREVVFEMALRLIAAGEPDAISIATTALRVFRQSDETMADVLRD